MRKNWFLLSLMIFLLLSVLSACSKTAPSKLQEETVSKGKSDENSGNLTGTSLPVVKDPITLKMLAPSNANWNDIMFWKEYKKMSNVNVEWETIPHANFTVKRNLMLNGGSYPDAIYKANLSITDLINYGSQGVIVKLNDLIDKNAPNFKKIMQQNPDIKKAISMPDGNIYSLPMLFDPAFTSVRTGGKTWVKKEWLDGLGIALNDIKTTDDFYRLLKSIKEKYPEAIPYGGYKDQELTGLISYLKGAWGLSNRGNQNPIVDVDPKTNKLRFIPTDPNFKELLLFIHQIYNDKLIDPNLFSMDVNQYYAKGATGVYGAMTNVNPAFLMNNQKGYVGLPVLKGPHGDQLYTAVSSPVIIPGAFVITDKNKHPAETVKWADYMYGDEGIKMFFMGTENVTYRTNDKGDLEYTEEFTQNKEGLTFAEVIEKYFAWPKGGYPSMVKLKYFKSSESDPKAIEAAERFAPYLPKEVWPGFVFTDAENQRMIALKADIETYVNEMQTKFVTGKTPFTEWDNYESKLKKMGLDEYMKIYEASYKRYQSN